MEKNKAAAGIWLKKAKDDFVYYFDRYPADIPLNLTEEDAAFALATADKILRFVEEIVSKA